MSEKQCLCGHFESCQTCNPHKRIKKMTKKSKSPIDKTAKKQTNCIKIDGSVAILAFSLPENAEDFKLAQQGIRYHCAVYELLNEMRSDFKHGKGDKKSHYWYMRLHSLLQDEGIEI